VNHASTGQQRKKLGHRSLVDRISNESAQAHAPLLPAGNTFPVEPSGVILHQRAVCRLLHQTPKVRLERPVPVGYQHLVQATKKSSNDDVEFRLGDQLPLVDQASRRYERHL